MLPPSVVKMIRVLWLVLLAASGAGAQQPEAPALRELREAIRRGDPNALDRFWSGPAAVTPLVSDDAGDSATVTFVYRGDSTVQSVQLESPLRVLAARPGDDTRTAGAFQKIGRTDVWFLSVRAPNALRAGYKLRVSRQDSISEAVLDPRNPQVFMRDNRELAASMLVLRKAPPQPWRGQTLAGGVWSRAPLPGDTTREVFVYTPSRYDAKARLPILLAMGSLSFGRMIPLDNIVEFLAAQRLARPAVVVLVNERPSNDTTGLADNRRLIEEQVLPFVRSRYRVSDRAADVVFVGASRRGVIGTSAALTAQSIGTVLSLSGGFSWRPGMESEHEWIRHFVATTPRRDVRFYLYAGTLETGINSGNQGHYLLGTNRALRDVLLARGYRLDYRESPGVHSEISWEDALAAALPVVLPWPPNP